MARAGLVARDDAQLRPVLLEGEDGGLEQRLVELSTLKLAQL
jgi:hypothetical protein